MPLTPGGLDLREASIDEALAPMQTLASRLWSPRSRHHPGQLAWSARYALPEDLGHGPVGLVHARDGRLVGWAWAEAVDWLELCVEPDLPDALDLLVGWFVGQAGTRTVRTMVLESEPHLAPQRIYRALGFNPGARTRTLRREP